MRIHIGFRIHWSHFQYNLLIITRVSPTIEYYLRFSFYQSTSIAFLPDQQDYIHHDSFYFVYQDPLNKRSNSVDFLKKTKNGSPIVAKGVLRVRLTKALTLAVSKVHENIRINEA
jgi:hypothetical protein